LKEVGSLPTRTVRRWPAWKPWAVVGAGALLALVGVPVLLEVKSNLDAYDAGVQTRCSSGCMADNVPPDLTALRDRAHTENIVAVSLFAIGGVVAATGVALVIMNQPRIVPAEEGTHATVAPLVGRGTVGLSVAFER
jgi:hypothetical protein